MMNYQQFITKLPLIAPALNISSDYLEPLHISQPEQSERDQAILAIVKTLLDTPHKPAGPSRSTDWHSGWMQNLIEYECSNDIASLIPKYYGKYPFIRYDSKLWKVGSPHVEHNSVKMLMHYVYERFLATCSTIVELGCGTGHHLYQLASIDSSKTFYGLDWSESSQTILNLLQSRNDQMKIIGKTINFFSPPTGPGYIPNGAAIFTFAALEQIGSEHDRIIDFILSSNPKIVVHLEPIDDLLDQDCLIEYLSTKYFRHRNYLSGFLSSLQSKAHEGSIKIHYACKTGVGSQFIEGYSLIVWSPAN